jgi:ATP-dependent Clp protease ATP-binding subunit ClpA
MNPSNVRDANRAYRDAHELFEDGDFLEASRTYGMVINLAGAGDAQYQSAHFQRALCYAFLGNFKASRRDAAEVERLRPLQDAAYLNGYIAELDGQFAEAVTWYERALRRDPNSAQARSALENLRHRQIRRHRRPGRQATSDAPLAPRTGPWREGPSRYPTPKLDDCAEDLTLRAMDGGFAPLVGREDQLEALFVALGQADTANAVLLGPAGGGKTAIAEELARRIASGNVPEHLINTRLLALNLSRLLRKSKWVGNTEKAVAALIREAIQSDVVLFIDELHTLVGAGSVNQNSTRDVGQMLKSELGRGRLRIVGATTDEEFRQFIEGDAALTQRFMRIRVPELSIDDTCAVLDARASARGVHVPAQVIRYLVEVSADLLPGRALPRGAIQLLDALMTRAILGGKLELPDARRVVSEATGLPEDPGSCANSLHGQLIGRSVLGAEDAGALVDVVGMRLLGISPQKRHPIAVIGLIGEAADRSAGLTEVLATCLYGTDQAQVTIDLTAAGDDPSALVGVPLGRGGHNARISIHDIIARPGSVVRVRGIEGVGWRTRAVLANALKDGVLVDSAGVLISLRTCVVIIEASGEHVEGTPAEDNCHSSLTDAPPLASALGHALINQIDLLVAQVPTNGEVCGSAIEQAIKDASCRLESLYGIILRVSEESISTLAIDCNGQPDEAGRVIDQFLGRTLRHLVHEAREEHVLVEVGASGLYLVRQ